MLHVHVHVCVYSACNDIYMYMFKKYMYVYVHAGNWLWFSPYAYTVRDGGPHHGSTMWNSILHGTRGSVQQTWVYQDVWCVEPRCYHVLLVSLPAGSMFTCIHWDIYYVINSGQRDWWGGNGRDYLYQDSKSGSCTFTDSEYTSWQKLPVVFPALSSSLSAWIARYTCTSQYTPPDELKISTTCTHVNLNILKMDGRLGMRLTDNLIYSFSWTVDGLSLTLSYMFHADYVGRYLSRVNHQWS